MPSRRNAAPLDPNLCRRCQVQEPAITVRTEPLCNACFCKYVSTKVVKRMETFRVRHSEPSQKRVLLLALSMGPASMALLHVLSQHLKAQTERSGRTGFALHVLHVYETSPRGEETPSARLDMVKQRYPDHIYSTAYLSDIFSYGGLAELTGRVEDVKPGTGDNTSQPERLEKFIASLGSATSRTDVLQIVKRKLVVHLAQEQQCEAILWGDSTTKLAERTLAETAKGRGFSLPWVVADGQSPHGVPFYFPVREIMSKELIAYGSLVEPPLDDLILNGPAAPAVSTKNTTIDELMKQYFESVEREYPSIVANVVRTSGKLHATSISEIEAQCELCDMPLEGSAPERSRLCYGCARTLPQEAG